MYDGEFNDPPLRNMGALILPHLSQLFGDKKYTIIVETLIEEQPMVWFLFNQKNRIWYSPLYTAAIYHHDAKVLKALLAQPNPDVSAVVAQLWDENISDPFFQDAIIYHITLELPAQLQEWHDHTVTLEDDGNFIYF
ncbi:MAG: hypothetical protein WCO49_19805 [Nostocales cyanobacterium ELA608]